VKAGKGNKIAKGTSKKARLTPGRKLQNFRESEKRREGIQKNQLARDGKASTGTIRAGRRGGQKKAPLAAPNHQAQVASKHAKSVTGRSHPPLKEGTKTKGGTFNEK